MKTTILMFLVFSAPIVVLAQTPWSTPAPLADTTGNNLQPTFVMDINGYLDVYNMLVWQRNFGGRSQIFFKSFENPQAEIPISPDLPGVFASNPSAAVVFNYPNPDYTLVVWQANQYGNEDLFSVLYRDGQFGTINRVTTDTLDDTNPHLRNNYLVWEREGNILFTEYIYTDSTWSAEIILDSMNASRPVAGFYYNYMPLVVYEKNFSIFMKKRSSSQVWQPSQLIASEGENSLPKFVPGWLSFILWQHRRDTFYDWDVMSYNLQWQSFDSLTFRYSNETRIQGVDFLWITEKDFEGPTIIAFESDIDGNAEIYAKEPLFGQISNISQFIGIDTIPAVSDFSYAEAQNLQFRVWCAWQRFINGKWQIWGSFTELDWGMGISDLINEKSLFMLYQNYPNPFNSTTTINYQLTVGSEVEITIYNVAGQQIRTLVKETRPAGYYEVEWDGKDNTGREVASGVYIYRLKAGNYIQSKKMLLLR